MENTYSKQQPNATRKAIFREATNGVGAPIMWLPGELVEEGGQRFLILSHPRQVARDMLAFTVTTETETGQWEHYFSDILRLRRMVGTAGRGQI